MDNLDGYYLNPNIDGSIQDFFDRALGIVKTNEPGKIDVKQLTLIAILDCIDAAIDYNDRVNFRLLSKLIMELQR
jgi:hypothetical protein